MTAKVLEHLRYGFANLVHVVQAKDNAKGNAGGVGVQKAAAHVAVGRHTGKEPSCALVAAAGKTVGHLLRGELQHFLDAHRAGVGVDGLDHAQLRPQQRIDAVCQNDRTGLERFVASANSADCAVADQQLVHAHARHQLCAGFFGLAAQPLVKRRA